MTDMQTYNGWTNYPTWAVALWIDNEQGTQERAQELARSARERAGETDAYAAGIWTQEQAERFTLAEWIEHWVTYELSPDLGATMAADLFGYALSLTNWDEIAQAYLSALTTA